MTIRKLTVVAAALAVGIVFAEDAEEKEDAEESAEQAPSQEKAEAKKPDAKVFTTLPFCKLADGIAEAKLPGAQEWAAVVEGKFYPLGTCYRTRGEDSRLIIDFGPESRVCLDGDSSFGTRVQALDVASRTIVAETGTVKLELPRTLSEGSFVVSTRAFTIRNLAGESKIVTMAKADGFDTVVRCVTGNLALEGRHFSIAQMRAADEIRIRSTLDNLETILYGTSGDYVVKLDRGIVPHNEYDKDSQEMKVVSSQDVLEWHLSPKTKVRINRLLPALGARMSVAVMTFDAAGALKNNFAFCEGRAEVNSGELVRETKPEGEVDEKKKTDAEADQTVTEKPADEDDDEKEESQNNNTKEKKEEE